MCQINEKETMECNCKQICCKMQDVSLRCAINALKNNRNGDSETVHYILVAIYDLLSVYSCLPGTCLLKRVRQVCSCIQPSIFSPSEANCIQIDMLIAELEAFLNNS